MLAAKLNRPLISMCCEFMLFSCSSCFCFLVCVVSLSNCMLPSIDRSSYPHIMPTNTPNTDIHNRSHSTDTCTHPHPGIAHWPTQLKPNAEHRRGAAPPARPPPPQSTPASYYNHPYAAHPHVESKPPRHTSTPTRPRQPLPTADSSSFDSPPDVQSPPIPPRRQGSSNAIVAATAAAVSAEISKLERNCWKDEPGNDSVRSSNASSSSATSSSSGASFVTAASTFSHLNVSDPPIPTPRAKREVHQLRR